MNAKKIFIVSIIAVLGALSCKVLDNKRIKPDVVFSTVDFSTEGLSNVGFSEEDILFRNKLLGTWTCSKLLSYDTSAYLFNCMLFPKENHSLSNYPSEIPKNITFLKSNKWQKIVKNNRYIGYRIDKNGNVERAKRGNLLEKIIAYHPNSNMGYPEISYPSFRRKDSINGYEIGHLLGDFWYGGFDYYILEISEDSMVLKSQNNRYLYLKNSYSKDLKK